MRKIRLYGVLAKKFGKEFELDVKSPAEAVRALCAILPGFKRHMVEHSEPGYTVRVGKEYRDLDTLADPSSTRDVIKVAPAIAGSNAVGRIIVGALIIAAVVMSGPGGWALAAGAGGGLTAMGAIAVGLGMSLVMGGVAELLTPTPKMKTTERPENLPSYTFDGPVNTIAQGNAVPVGYGRLTVGSQVVSAQLMAENLQVGHTTGGGSNLTGLAGMMYRVAMRAIESGKSSAT